MSQAISRLIGLVGECNLRQEAATGKSRFSGRYADPGEESSMGGIIEFARSDGGRTSGYQAVPDGAQRGVVVVQEWWGLNDHICGVADRFARHGYATLAPELYEGRVTQSPDEANHLMEGLDFAGATTEDIRGAVQHLKRAGCEKVAVMGFCMGGALTVAAGVHVKEADSGVCFYGIPPAEFADPTGITMPFQAHFANRDDWCTPAAVDALEQAMTGGWSSTTHSGSRNRPRRRILPTWRRSRVSPRSPWPPVNGCAPSTNSPGCWKPVQPQSCR